MTECKEFYFNEDKTWTIIYKDGTKSIVEKMPIDFTYIGISRFICFVHNAEYIESCRWSFEDDGALCPILNNISPFPQDNKWGFINSVFQIVVAPQFDYESGVKTTYRDIGNGEFIPDQTIYGLYWKDGKCTVLQNNKKTVINESDYINFCIERNTNYAYKLKYIDNLSFDKVRELAVRFYMDLPKPLHEELYDALNRGVDVLDSEPLMLAYLHAYGLMHQAKLNYAFNYLPDEFIMRPEINIIDYGCGQAIGTMCYIDYLNHINCSQKIKKITLVEPSELCLKRAALHASAFCPNAQIVTIKKSFDELNDNDFNISEESTTLHIFSNVLDILNFELHVFSWLINRIAHGYNIFACVSPRIGNIERDNRISKFASSFERDDFASIVLNKYELDPNKPWTCQISVFRKRFLINNIPSEIFERYKMLAENGDSNAQYSLGRLYCEENNKKEAFQWFNLSAYQDNGDVLTCLGCCYKNGYGVEKNIWKALESFYKGTNMNNSRARYALGRSYYLGEEVDLDYKKAIELYKKAAEQGLEQAQYALGLCYYYGKGVDIDYRQAAEWYEKAAEQENADAQGRLGECYRIGKGVAQDYKKSAIWYEKAAEHGDVDAQFIMCVYYFNGWGVVKDKRKAVEWCYKAAKQGHKKAIEALRKNKGNI